MATNPSGHRPEASEQSAVTQAAAPQKQKITYATLGAPDPTLHRCYDQALVRVQAALSQTHPMLIGGKPVTADSTFEDRSPISHDCLLGRFQKGTAGSLYYVQQFMHEQSRTVIEE